MRSTYFTKRIRITAALVLTVFLCHEAALARTDQTSMQRTVHEMPDLDFKIPPSIGFFQDRYEPKDAKKMIYLLEDAHTNESGQLNIAKALASVLEHHPMKYVFLEAGEGNVSLSFLRRKAPLAARKRVAESYLRKGLLQGSEYLDLVSDLPFTLWGVEDQTLYNEAIETYQVVTETREHYLDYLSRIESTLKALKPHIYHKELLGMDALRERYLSDEVSVADYFDNLAVQAEKLSIPLKTFPELSQLQKIRSLEKDIDFEKADTEQTEALELFGEKDRQDLSDAAEANRSPFKYSNHMNENSRAFYALLEEKLNESSNKRYPELCKYFIYLKQIQTLNASNLLGDQKKLEDAVFEGLQADPDERQLFEVSNTVRQFKKFMHLSSTPDEFQTYLQSRDRYDIAYVAGFLNRKIMDLKRLTEKAIFLDDGFRPALQKIASFYRLTQKRDEAFVQRMLEKMDNASEDRAVLIAGGYHTPNLKALLRRKNIAYAVITPQVLHETNMDRYEKLLLSQIQKSGGTTTAAKGQLGSSDMLAFHKVSIRPLVTGARAEIQTGQRGVRWQTSLRLAEDIHPGARLEMADRILNTTQPAPAGVRVGDWTQEVFGRIDLLQQRVADLEQMAREHNNTFIAEMLKKQRASLTSVRHKDFIQIRQVLLRIAMLHGDMLEHTRNDVALRESMEPIFEDTNGILELFPKKRGSLKTLNDVVDRANLLFRSSTQMVFLGIVHTLASIAAFENGLLRAGFILLFTAGGLYYYLTQYFLDAQDLLSVDMEEVVGLKDPDDRISRGAGARLSEINSDIDSAIVVLIQQIKQAEKDLRSNNRWDFSESLKSQVSKLHGYPGWTTGRLLETFGGVNDDLVQARNSIRRPGDSSSDLIDGLRVQVDEVINKIPQDAKNKEALDYLRRMSHWYTQFGNYWGITLLLFVAGGVLTPVLGMPEIGKISGFMALLSVYMINWNTKLKQKLHQRIEDQFGIDTGEGQKPAEGQDNAPHGSRVREANERIDTEIEILIRGLQSAVYEAEQGGPRYAAWAGLPGMVRRLRGYKSWSTQKIKETMESFKDELGGLLERARMNVDDATKIGGLQAAADHVIRSMPQNLHHRRVLDEIRPKAHSLRRWMQVTLGMGGLSFGASAAFHAAGFPMIAITISQWTFVSFFVIAALEIKRNYLLDTKLGPRGRIQGTRISLLSRLENSDNPNFPFPLIAETLKKRRIWTNPGIQNISPTSNHLSKMNFERAHRRVGNYVKKTPLIYAKRLSQLSGRKVYIKDESRQVGGSFKSRGVYNEVYVEIEDIVSSALDGDVQSRQILRDGVELITQTDGNHGIALVFAVTHAVQHIADLIQLMMDTGVYDKDAELIADIRKIKPIVYTIDWLHREKKIVLQDALEVHTALFGEGSAAVMYYDSYEDAANARKIYVRKQNSPYLNPEKGRVRYMDHGGPNILKGHGTAGMEIAEDLLAMGITEDQHVAVFVPVGAGGPLGVIGAFNQFWPNATGVMVQSDPDDAFFRTLKASRRGHIRMKKNNKHRKPTMIIPDENNEPFELVFPDGIVVDQPENYWTVEVAQSIAHAIRVDDRMALELSGPIMFADLKDYYAALPYMRPGMSEDTQARLGGASALTAEALRYIDHIPALNNPANKAEVVVLFATEGNMPFEVTKYLDDRYDLANGGPLMKRYAQSFPETVYLAGSRASVIDKTYAEPVGHKEIQIRGFVTKGHTRKALPERTPKREFYTTETNDPLDGFLDIEIMYRGRQIGDIHANLQLDAQEKIQRIYDVDFLLDLEWQHRGIMTEAWRQMGRLLKVTGTLEVPLRDAETELFLIEHAATILNRQMLEHGQSMDIMSQEIHMVGQLVDLAKFYAYHLPQVARLRKAFLERNEAPILSRFRSEIIENNPGGLSWKRFIRNDITSRDHHLNHSASFEHLHSWLMDSYDFLNEIEMFPPQFLRANSQGALMLAAGVDPWSFETAILKYQPNPDVEEGEAELVFKATKTTLGVEGPDPKATITHHLSDRDVILNTLAGRGIDHNHAGLLLDGMEHRQYKSPVTIAKLTKAQSGFPVMVAGFATYDWKRDKITHGQNTPMKFSLFRKVNNELRRIPFKIHPFTLDTLELGSPLKFDYELYEFKDQKGQDQFRLVLVNGRSELRIFKLFGVDNPDQAEAISLQSLAGVKDDIWLVSPQSRFPYFEVRVIDKRLTVIVQNGEETSRYIDLETGREVTAPATGTRFSRVGSFFDDFETNTHNEKDRAVLNQLLDTDLSEAAVIQKLHEDTHGRVYTAQSELTGDPLKGRSVYYDLEEPIQRGDVTVTTFKFNGRRLRRGPRGNVLAYLPETTSEHLPLTVEVTQKGKYKAKVLKPQPAGGMYREGEDSADHRFEMNRRLNATKSEHVTFDVPVATTKEDGQFESRLLGGIITALSGREMPFRFSGEDLVVYDVGTWQTSTIDESLILPLIGRAIRALRDDYGMFHNRLTLDKIGIQHLVFDADGRVVNGEIVIRDQETTHDLVPDIMAEQSLWDLLSVVNDLGTGPPHVDENGPAWTNRIRLLFDGYFGSGQYTDAMVEEAFLSRQVLTRLVGPLGQRESGLEAAPAEFFPALMRRLRHLPTPLAMKKHADRLEGKALRGFEWPDLEQLVLFGSPVRVTDHSSVDSSFTIQGPHFQYSIYHDKLNETFDLYRHRIGLFDPHQDRHIRGDEDRESYQRISHRLALRSEYPIGQGPLSIEGLSDLVSYADEITFEGHQDGYDVYHLSADGESMYAISYQPSAESDVPFHKIEVTRVTRGRDPAMASGSEQLKTFYVNPNPPSIPSALQAILRQEPDVREVIRPDELNEILRRLKFRARYGAPGARATLNQKQARDLYQQAGLAFKKATPRTGFGPKPSPRDLIQNKSDLRNLHHQRSFLRQAYSQMTQVANFFADSEIISEQFMRARWVVVSSALGTNYLREGLYTQKMKVKDRYLNQALGLLTGALDFLEDIEDQIRDVLAPGAEAKELDRLAEIRQTVDAQLFYVLYGFGMDLVKRLPAKEWLDNADMIERGIGYLEEAEVLLQEIRHTIKRDSEEMDEKIKRNIHAVKTKRLVYQQREKARAYLVQLKSGASEADSRVLERGVSGYLGRAQQAIVRNVSVWADTYLAELHEIDAIKQELREFKESSRPAGAKAAASPRIVEMAGTSARLVAEPVAFGSRVSAFIVSLWLALGTAAFASEPILPIQTQGTQTVEYRLALIDEQSGLKGVDRRHIAEDVIVQGLRESAQGLQAENSARAKTNVSLDDRVMARKLFDAMKDARVEADQGFPREYLNRDTELSILVNMDIFTESAPLEKFRSDVWSLMLDAWRIHKRSPRTRFVVGNLKALPTDEHRQHMLQVIELSQSLLTRFGDIPSADQKTIWFELSAEDEGLLQETKFRLGVEKISPEVIAQFYGVFATAKVTVSALQPLLEKEGGLAGIDQNDPEDAALIPDSIPQYVGKRAGREAPSKSDYLKLIRGKSKTLFHKYLQKSLKPVIDWAMEHYKMALKLLESSA